MSGASGRIRIQRVRGIRGERIIHAYQYWSLVRQVSFSLSSAINLLASSQRAIAHR